MKKTVSLIVSLCLVLCLIACEKAPQQNNGTPEAREMNESIIFSTKINTDNLHRDYPIPFSFMVTRGKPSAETSTGLSPLPTVTYIADENTGYFSEEKLSHSHGPAANGEAHYTVREFQQSFEPFHALTLDELTKEKVLYLTFDCGYEYDNLTADILDTLKEKQVPAAFFCTLDHIEREPELIARMIKEGHIVGNHSTTHPSFPDISRNEMASEIEQTENYLREFFGYSSKYFRFPAGEYSESSLDLVASLGYMSVFWSVAYNDWDTNNRQGADYAARTVLSRLHNGAVILLHSVSRDNAEALAQIIDQARSQGYTFKSLDFYARQLS